MHRFQRGELERAYSEGLKQGHEDRERGHKDDLSLGAKTLPRDWHFAYAKGYAEGQKRPQDEQPS